MRVYSGVFEGVTVSAVQDFFELTAPATKVVQIHEVHITQDTDETSQQLPCRILRIPATVTGGSGGTTPTPVPMEVGDPAASSTLKANNTAVATTSGTLLTLRRMADNLLNGFHWVFLPESRIVIPPSGVVVVRLVTAPTVGLPFSGEIIFSEQG